MKKIALWAALAAVMVPISTFAQSPTPTFQGAIAGSYLMAIISFINTYLIPFIWAIAFIVFIWGVFLYFIAGGANEEKRDQGKQLVFWGVIAFVVMTSLWGLVNLLVNSFGFNAGQNTPNPPRFDFTPRSSVISTEHIDV